MAITEPPATGNSVIDAALAEAAAAATADVAAEAQCLSDAQSVLADVLRASRENVPTSSDNGE